MDHKFRNPLLTVPLRSCAKFLAVRQDRYLASSFGSTTRGCYARFAN